MKLRKALPSDAAAVAELHTDSWRNTYRGILSDYFLDHEIFENRLAHWQRRLSDRQPDTQLVLLAEEPGQLIGFTCVFLDADPRWGALLDNLHVRFDTQSRGVGRQLMSQAIAWILKKRPDSGLYLWLFEGNHQARGFYERLGGIPVEKQLQRAPGGTDVIAVRYGWRNLYWFPKTADPFHLKEFEMDRKG
jgi:GNAT superfamily N-acetyltransferase